jgi:hypothetical protein
VAAWKRPAVAAYGTAEAVPSTLVVIGYLRVLNHRDTRLRGQRQKTAKDAEGFLIRWAYDLTS